MGPTTYALCQKPVIGIVMWITALCGFPPLFADEPIALSREGSTITREFEAPVDLKYPLNIDFEFESTQARLDDSIVGYRFDANCWGNKRYDDIPERQREGLGRPMPFRVMIRHAADRAVVLDRVFDSLCITSHRDNLKTRTIGWLELRRGQYTAEVTNLEAQAGLEHVVTRVSLVGGRFK
ncbi:DUF5625 family protein [Azohydromonas caseinilytica]|uniref:DUF5625 domain-containing protein n=1 Tax=Azohydromonas caseinilytica TaxID=2728836 RepID=A0A848FIZ1_9BURK|nr:DUF5625 family protein [Azohydromonas caseinilytica]NML18259.1 hypothetical protein [Azohydromonas caseinilytica]